MHESANVSESGRIKRTIHTAHSTCHFFPQELPNLPVTTETSIYRHRSDGVLTANARIKISKRGGGNVHHWLCTCHVHKSQRKKTWTQLPNSVVCLTKSMKKKVEELASQAVAGHGDCLSGPRPARNLVRPRRLQQRPWPRTAQRHHGTQRECSATVLEIVHMFANLPCNAAEVPEIQHSFLCIAIIPTTSYCSPTSTTSLTTTLARKNL
ncbi:hypothetical protein PsorP6_011164 [Peronosclerospora sorghi]|uniref:Uncharacterized protein n=1 Tax=Peronosclerospora sorghi TaxID=230839 RepID=A0ACC0VYE9_9STRA|nr:hypothetical protein PsorP6_011164 [Peronosclerospora sorghi]